MNCAILKSLSFSIVIFCFLNATALWATQDTFMIQMDPQGWVVEGNGSGYENGQWFLYPYSEWWNQWFYNGPFEPDGTKQVNLTATLRGDYAGAAAYAEIAINWSTDRWSSGQNRPPLPGDITSASYENQVIKRSIVFQGEIQGQRSINVSMQIGSYCPEWVSIDVRGTNFTLEGTIKHECVVSEQPQACCFPDGHCEDLTAAVCQEQGGTPQGEGTDCANTQCTPQPTGACCLADGSCTELTAARCQAAGGTFQGQGTDCATVNCNECAWDPNDPHKMHWPQRPKTGGWDVEFGSSVLADDWMCTETGPVEDLHFWISWMKNQRTTIPGFTVTLYSDVPDPDGKGPEYSTPGQVLWTRFFEPGLFQVHDMPQDMQGWFDPSVNGMVPQDHTLWQQIDICHIADPFIQEEGSIYWLAVDFGTLPFIGWKQSGSQHFNDDGVWWDKASKQWVELHDPLVGQSLDLAFVITGGQTPAQEFDFGDAPEGSLAYPDSCVQGRFPTCINIGTATWIQHKTDKMYLGPMADLELDGNAGKCPLFNPEAYNQDECFGDGDAGLMGQPSHTIKGPVGDEFYWTCAGDIFGILGETCTTAVWGDRIDMEVHNRWASTTGATGTAYMNVLIDWNRDGAWGGSSPCAVAAAPEHVLVNFPIPSMYEGLLSGLNPPNFLIGPLGGYCWARFTISEKPVPEDWDGSGDFNDGETEDYLLYVRKPFQPSDCDWLAGDPYKMHWPQMPDLEPTGIDVDAYWTPLADDFKCSETGPITDIHLWGSFANDCLPAGGVDSIRFRLSIYSDIPASANRPWSQPGQSLWTREFGPDQYNVRRVGDGPEAWYDPVSVVYEPNNHRGAYQYNFCIDDPFTQKKDTIYWLVVQILPAMNDGTVTPVSDTGFGWKTCRPEQQFNDNAVYRSLNGVWTPLRYPENHQWTGNPLDLAFVITGQSPPAIRKLDFGDAPDPASAAGYPTLLASNGARHVIVPRILLGTKIDPEPDGQPNATATGDDLSTGDDEDGVTFTSSLLPGATATIEVVTSASGYLNTWIDYQGNQNWNDAGEHVFVDLPLTSGTHNLSFTVPNSAQLGQTFARFRYSSVRGLNYDGLAPDGEVEDYLITIGDGNEPSVVDPNIKWSQPPIEHDPKAKTPLFCGWDEASFIRPGAKPNWPIWVMVADDFRCLGSMPVTQVHWWGSYLNWQENLPPEQRPDRWRITFWTNEEPNQSILFSRPGKLLWMVTVPDKRVREKRIGLDRFPEKSEDTCFKYSLALEPNEVFWQENFLKDSPKRIFWIGISAVYDTDSPPKYLWGWKTRPWHWMDDAVVFTLPQPGVDPHYTDDMNLVIEPNFIPDANVMHPLENALVCKTRQSYDMAFELQTDPRWVKWQQAFTGLRKWPHYEDEPSYSGLAWASSIAIKWEQPPDGNATSLAIDATRDIPNTTTWNAQVLADDFECTWGGPITGISIWSSWMNDLMPLVDSNQLRFTLCLHSDIPAASSSTGYSMPGLVLWQKTYGPGEYSVFNEPDQAQGFYSACNNFYRDNDHNHLLRYSFGIDPCEAFVQQGTEAAPIVYWLSVQAQWTYPPGLSLLRRFGWNTSYQSWNDAAVWSQSTAPHAGTWQKLAYPSGHGTYNELPVNLAFRITTSDLSFTELIQHQVADDWQCKTKDPVTAAVWWGSYVGHKVQPCACQTLPEPNKPDYFLLSIWSDIPASGSNDFSHPGELLWQYRAHHVDEVMVGFDKHPEGADIVPGREAVYRYSVRLPKDKWFYQAGDKTIYWFSVVAVYDRDISKLKYPWGWTNHPKHFSDHAVTGHYPSGYPWGDTLQWQPLYDQSGAGEDLSFMLFTEPKIDGT